MTSKRRSSLSIGDRVALVTLAVTAWVPLLLTNPGRVGGDTKAYLTIDPSQWLSKVAWLWSPAIGAGGVTHQNIGYLWPMGPWFWVLDRLGVPMWAAQRLWLEALLFAAGTGTWWLCRRFVSGRIAVVAAFAYMLSPYVLQYSERMSVMLLPWSGLPWLLGLTILARRQRTWLAPALFALVLGTVGGINATSVILIGLGPLLWLVYAVVLPRQAGTADEVVRTRITRSLGAAMRIGVLSLLTGAWWMAGLRNQGAFGLPILRYTETYETVANSSAAPEVLRALGHWYFYGGDQLGAWVQPSVTYTERPWVIALSFALPIVSLAGLVLFRFRHRLFFAALVVVGTLVAVGAHPFDAPSALGRVFTAVMGTETGLALRSTPRAIPLLVLGLAVGLGALAAGITDLVTAALARTRRSPRPVAAVVSIAAVLVVAANLLPLWDGTIAADRLARPEDIPGYWLEAAAAVDAAGTDTRVLELPGTDFAAYRWGNTVDDALPGLIDRPSLARELIPSGTPQSAALLLALDRRYLEGTAESTALAPIARLLGVGDVLLRNDLEWERFNTPRPFRMWNSLLRAPGLAPPLLFGPLGYNERASGPLLDTIGLSQPPNQPASAPVALFAVSDALPIIRTVRRAEPMVMAGDAEGLVDLAAQGLLDPRQAIFFAASFAADPAALRSIVDDGAVLVLTDTNAKQGLRWGTIRENRGAVERADESTLRFDPADNRLDVFVGQTTDDQTVAVQTGARISATAYGNSVSFSPGERPFLAFDGDPTTAWRVGAFDDVVGDRIVADLDTPATVDRIVLRQPTDGNRWITRVRVTVGNRSFDTDLGPDPLAPQGVTLEFPSTTADRVAVEVLATNVGRVPSYRDFSGVGFSEIAIGDVRVTESLRLPTTLLGLVGTDELAHRTLVMISRNRIDPANPFAVEPERTMRRTVVLPSTRAWSAVGTVRIDPQATDATLRALLGVTDPVVVTASSWLPTDVVDRGRAAFDGDPGTWWTPSTTDTAAPWVQIDSPRAGRTGAVRVTYATDGRHSIPAGFTVIADGRVVGTAAVPDQTDGPAGATATIDIPITPGTDAASWRVTVDGVHPRTSVPWFGGAPDVVPVAIAAIDGLPERLAPLPTTIDSGCRDDLVRVDGSVLPVRAVGRTAAVRAGDPLQLLSCAATTIAAGSVSIETTDARRTGLAVDRLVLGSAVGGAAIPVGVAPDATSVDQRGYRSDVAPTGASIRVVAERPDRIELEIDDLTDPSWLVLGQSYSTGWSAHSPELGTLGAPTLIEGFANGWRLDASTGTVRVVLTWTPQRVVWIGIAVSIVGTLLCLALVLLPWFRRRRTSATTNSDANDTGLVDAELGADIDATNPVTVPADRFDLAGLRARVPGTGWRTTVVGGLLAAVLAAMILPEWQVAAVPIGLAAGVVLRTGRFTRIFALLAPASLSLAGAYSVLREWRGKYPNYTWPGIMSAVNVLGVVTIAVLGAWIVISALRGEDEDQPAGGV